VTTEAELSALPWPELLDKAIELTHALESSVASVERLMADKEELREKLAEIIRSRP
jgi:hypothetical protein